MDPESIEKYTALAKQLNIPQGEMINFIRSMHKEEREERSCSVNRRRKISWRKKREWKDVGGETNCR